jgi:sugar phosphate isomerase/epimerase
MHARVSVNSTCFPGAGWPELDAIVRELRPPRISLVSLMTNDDPAPVKALLEAGGCGLETVVHPFLYGETLDADEPVLAEAQARLSRLIDLVAAVGGRSIYMGTGGRGRLGWDAAAARFSAAVAPCVAHARAAGVALMIENTPSLFADMSMAHSLRDAVTLAEAADLGVCLDVFGCWTEAGLKNTIARAIPRCGLVQISDYVLGDRTLPGRAVPGDGDIPIAQMIEWALEAGYDGVFDLELTGPRIAQEGHVKAVARAADRVGGILRTLGA